MHRIVWLCGVLLLTFPMVGCRRTVASLPPAKPPVVDVSRPVLREIVDYEDFQGRTEAVADVLVRARVTGYLQEVCFKEGAEVQQGQKLFVIDPRSYQAELKRAEAELLQSQARLRRLEASFKRAAALRPAHAISEDDYETIMGDRDAAAAAVKLAEAERELAKLNVEYTTVTAPVRGRLGRQMIDPGNMVKADDTVLTRIVSQDPIYAYFDVNERTTLRIRRLIQSGKVKSARDATTDVFIGVADEKEKDLCPHKGTINFIDNRLDSGTGTLRLRGVFENHDRLLSPELYVHVRVPIGAARQAVLIAEEALGSDQGQKFVYVLNDKNEIAYRRVEIGALHDGLRAIEEGLTANDRVVTNGLQRIRPGMTVEPNEPKVKSAQPVAAKTIAPTG